MDVSTRSHTTVTCNIELEPDEQFSYKPSWWRRTRRVTHLKLEWDHFKMFERDAHGSLWSISRDGYRDNVHFDLADVPSMPENVRQVVDANLAKLLEQYLASHTPADMLF